MNHKIVWMAALCAGLFTGCGAARPSRYYELTIPGNAAPAAQAGAYPVTLLIGPMSASQLYLQNHIVYSLGGETMGTYDSQRWTELPTQMVEDVLLRELRSSGSYKMVDVLHSNSASGGYIIHGRLYDFKEVDVPMLLARVTFEFEMRDPKTGATVWTHYYSHDEPVASKDVSAVVAALDHNAQLGVDEIKSSLAQYFSTHSGD